MESWEQAVGVAQRGAGRSTAPSRGTGRRRPLPALALLYRTARFSSTQHNWKGEKKRETRGEIVKTKTAQLGRSRRRTLQPHNPAPAPLTCSWSAPRCPPPWRPWHPALRVQVVSGFQGKDFRLQGWDFRRMWITHDQTREASSLRVTWEKETEGAEPRPSGHSAAVMGRKAAGNGLPLVGAIFQHDTPTLQTQQSLWTIQNTTNRTRISVQASKFLLKALSSLRTSILL